MAGPTGRELRCWWLWEGLWFSVYPLKYGRVQGWLAKEKSQTIFSVSVFCFLQAPEPHRESSIAFLCLNHDYDWTSAPIKPGSVLNQSWITHPVVTVQMSVLMPLWTLSTCIENSIPMHCPALPWHSLLPHLLSTSLFLPPSPHLSYLSAFLASFVLGPKCLNMLKTADFLSIRRKGLIQ